MAGSRATGSGDRCHAAGAAMTLAEARAKDLFVAARIVRNGVVVREHRWRASALPDGPLELMASRLGDHFAFRVGSLQPGLELIDVIPLVPSSEPAAIGARLARGRCASRACGSRTRRVTRARSPLEPGDALYNANEVARRGRFLSRGAGPRRRARTPRRPLTSVRPACSAGITARRSSSSRRRPGSAPPPPPAILDGDGASLPPSRPGGSPTRSPSNSPAWRSSSRS